MIVQNDDGDRPPWEIRDGRKVLLTSHNLTSGSLVPRTGWKPQRMPYNVRVPSDGLQVTPFSDRTPYHIVQSVTNEIFCYQLGPARIKFQNVKYVVDHAFFVARELNRMPTQYLLESVAPEGVLFVWERALLWNLAIYSQMSKWPVCRSLFERHFEGAYSLLTPLYWELQHWGPNDRAHMRADARKKIEDLIENMARTLEKIGEDGDFISEEESLFFHWCGGTEKKTEDAKAKVRARCAQLSLRFAILIVSCGFSPILRGTFVRKFFDKVLSEWLDPEALPDDLETILLEYPEDDEVVFSNKFLTGGVLFTQQSHPHEHDRSNCN